MSLTLIAATCLLGAGLSPLALAQNEAYTAVAQVPGAGGQTTFNFTITKWSAPDDLKRLGAILKEKGQSGLLEELKKMDSGRINKIGDTGNQIALAEKWQDGSDTVITLIAARRMSLSEEKSRAVSTKYPFGFLQVRLNANGEGKGTMVAAAAIKYDEKTGAPRLEPFGNGATPVNNVKPLK